MDIQTQRRLQRHKWQQLVSIKREAEKRREPKDRPRAKRAKCHPRYYLLGG